MQEIPKQSETTGKEVFRSLGCLTLCQVLCDTDAAAGTITAAANAAAAHAAS